MLENWNSLFDEINVSTIIDIDNINNVDELLNNKNIVNLYNETNNKLNQLNKELLLLIDDVYKNLLKNSKTNIY